MACGGMISTKNFKLKNIIYFFIYIFFHVITATWTLKAHSGFCPDTSCFVSYVANGKPLILNPRLVNFKKISLFNS